MVKLWDDVHILHMKTKINAIDSPPLYTHSVSSVPPPLLGYSRCLPPSIDPPTLGQEPVTIQQSMGTIQQ